MKYKLERVTQSKRVEQIGPAHTGHFRSKTSGEVPDGMSYREIGKALGISYAAVADIEKRALAKVKLRLIKALELEGVTI